MDANLEEQLDQDALPVEVDCHGIDGVVIHVGASIVDERGLTPPALARETPTTSAEILHSLVYILRGEEGLTDISCTIRGCLL